jgi:hypothetical protein
VLCQVYFCDLSALDHSIEGVAFSQNRCLFVGAARSRTLSIAPGDRGATRDAQRPFRSLALASLRFERKPLTTFLQNSLNFMLHLPRGIYNDYSE